MKIIFITFYDPGAKGVYSLAAQAEHLGAEVGFINLGAHNKQPFPMRPKNTHQVYDNISGGCYVLADRLASPCTYDDLEVTAQHVNNCADFAAISTRSFAMDYAEHLASMIHVPILTGGWGPTLEYDRASAWADYVCVGEGEHVIEELLRGVPINRLQRCYPPLTSEDLDRLPLPYFRGPKYQVKEGALVPSLYPNSRILVSRGCPLACTYCMSGQYRTIYKAEGYRLPKVRMRSVDSVVSEGRYIIETNPSAKSCNFMDEVFPWDKQWLEGFLDRWPKEVGLPINGYLRPEFHSDDTIVKLKNLGLCNTAVGIQAVDSQILKKVFHRPTTTSTNDKFINTLLKAGITPVYHLIVSNPYETETQLHDKLKWLWKAPYAATNTFRLAFFPNSPISRFRKHTPPKGAGEALQEWYAWLQSVAALSWRKRLLSKVVYRLRLFKRQPEYLLLFSFLVHQVKGWVGGVAQKRLKR